jgi:YHS domain-containing protein
MKKVLFTPALIILVLFLAFNTQSQDKQKNEKVKADKESCRADKESCRADKESCRADKESCGAEKESCGADKESCGAEKDCCSDAAETKVKTTSAKPWNTVCPVQGEKVNPKVKTVKYNGKEYGFCCTGCDEKFRTDPAKYAKNLDKDGKVFASK